MRITILTTACLCGLLLSHGALAERYTVVDGALEPTGGDRPHEITGGFEASLSPYTAFDSETQVAILDDFLFHIAGRTFEPREPLVYAGLRPMLFVEIADQIHFDEEFVSFFRIRSGGDVIGVGDETVIFRSFEFRNAEGGGGRVAGALPDSELPRRFHLEGNLIQIDQRFEISDSCGPIIAPPRPIPLPSPPEDGVTITATPIGPLPIVEPIAPLPPLQPIDGGAVISIAPGGELIEPVALDASVSGGSVALRAPLQDPAPLNRVVGGTLTAVGGELQVASVVMIAAPGVSFNPMVLQVTELPTLDELNIRAPEGCEITSDEDGFLVLECLGSVFLDGPLPDLSGFDGIRIKARRIFASEAFEFLPGTRVDLEADEVVIGPPGGGDDPVVIELPPTPCLRLAGRPEEKDLGAFTLVASAGSRPVNIDVLPWREPNRLRLGSRQLVPVALLGSERLDVRDVDRGSLRLGPNGAGPIDRFGFPLVFAFDVNQDDRLDLFALFTLRSLGVAFGDTDLCLSAETRDGVALEGCDAIETLPGGRPRWERRRGPSASSSAVSRTR